MVGQDTGPRCFVLSGMQVGGDDDGDGFLFAIRRLVLSST